MMIEIESIAKMNLGPDDVLLCALKHKMGPDQLMDIRKHIEKILPGRKMIFYYPDEFDFKVITKDDASTLRNTL